MSAEYKYTLISPRPAEHAPSAWQPMRRVDLQDGLPSPSCVAELERQGLLDKPGTYTLTCENPYGDEAVTFEVVERAVTQTITTTKLVPLIHREQL